MNARAPSQGRRDREERSPCPRTNGKDYSNEVRVQANRDTPGVVSLSVLGLEGSASHAVLDNLSSQAGARVEERLETTKDGAAYVLGGAARG
jgi:hypothetical protein